MGESIVNLNITCHKHPLSKLISSWPKLISVPLQAPDWLFEAHRITLGGKWDFYKSEEKVGRKVKVKDWGFQSEIMAREKSRQEQKLLPMMSTSSIIIWSCFPPHTQLKASASRLPLSTPRSLPVYCITIKLNSWYVHRLAVPNIARYTYLLPAPNQLPRSSRKPNKN